MKLRFISSRAVCYKRLVVTHEQLTCASFRASFYIHVHVDE